MGVWRMQLNDALKVDGEGRPTDRHQMLNSRSWDEIWANADQIYMPYRLRPRGRGNPRGSNYVAQVGSFTVNRTGFDGGSGQLISTRVWSPCWVA